MVALHLDSSPRLNMTRCTRAGLRSATRCALPDDSNALVFNYGTVNSGHTVGLDMLNGMTQAGLQAAGAALGGGDGATAGDAASSQGFSTLLSSFTHQFFTNCDGVVATDVRGSISPKMRSSRHERTRALTHLAAVARTPSTTPRGTSLGICGSRLVSSRRQSRQAKLRGELAGAQVGQKTRVATL